MKCYNDLHESITMNSTQPRNRAQIPLPQSNSKLWLEERPLFMSNADGIDFRAVWRKFILLLDNASTSGSREPKVFPPKLEIH